jgi:vesicle-associated membrane protein 4
MRDNVDKVLERAEKVKELDERANSLQESSTQFVQHAARLRRQQYWENMKWKIILSVVSAVVLIVILLGIAKI